MIKNKNIKIFFAAILLIVTGLSPAMAQRRPRGGQQFGVRQAKQIVLPDSLQLARLDSLHRADSLHRVDSVALLGKSSLDTPAFSEARDSIVEVFSNGKRTIYYYGDVSVTSGDIKLTAEQMEYDMNTGTVYAHGVYDSLSGEWKGRPVMEQAGKTYNMEEVRYNFDTRKARITNMITHEEDGILHGRNIKMMPDNSINMTKGKYTVCDAEHPHYWLELELAKVMTEPSQKTVFGPAHLVVEDVHLPFIGLPFGFIPKRPERATGFLMPTFGQEEARGFFFKDAGMYFVFGDYFDLSVTGSYFTLGSWGLDVNSRYKVNYKCNGNLSFNYNHDQTGEKGTPEFFETSNFGFKWSHSQDSKAHPGTTFSASVNFSSPSNSRYNSRSVSEALQNQISSSISWSRNWNGKISLSLNAMHSQNSRDSSYTFTLPNLSFNINTFYPFKQKNRVGKEKFYEKFSFRYGMTFNNKINFKASEFDLKSKQFLDKFENGMNHSFGIGLPSFQLLKYINISPSVSYGMNMYFRDFSPEYDKEKDRVVTSKNSAFSTIGMMHTASGSVSMSTRIYGTFNFGKHHKVQAIRHVISPSMSFNYTPNLIQDWNGYKTFKYQDKQGVDKEFMYNRFTGASASAGKQSASANLTIGNNLEAKVRDYADTTGNGSKKVKLIDQFNISTGYDFIADSCNRLKPISMSMSTNLFGKVSISASASFDPYALDKNAKKIGRFAIQEGQGLMRLTNANLSASYSISGKGHINGNDGTKADGRGSNIQGAAEYYQKIFYHPVTGEFIPGGWLYYTNPDVPWSLNFNANFQYSAKYSYDKENDALKKDNNFTATVSFNGNIKLTPKLSINASSGYDFMMGKITPTQFSATYNLHCFNISVSWVPTGQWKSYSFLICANAAALSDLLRFRKSDSYWDN